jgi:hypothetical protein
LNFAFPRRTLTLSVALGVLLTAVVGGCSSSSTADEGSPPDAAAGGSSGASGSSGGNGDSAAPWDGGVASSCFPADVSTYKPTWRKSAKFYQGVCTPGDLTSFRSACLGPDISGCAKAVSAECAKCIATDEAADVYGAIIVHKGWAEPNVPGCVANAMGDPTGVRCAGAMQAAQMCELAACAANCPVTSDATLSQLADCRSAADKGQCSGLVNDAQCVQGLGEAGPDVAACFSGKSFAEAYMAVAGLFCLPNPTPPPVDAGGGG